MADHNDLLSLRMRLIDDIGAGYLKMWEELRQPHETHNKLLHLVSNYGAEEVKRMINERTQRKSISNLTKRVQGAHISLRSGLSDAPIDSLLNTPPTFSTGTTANDIYQQLTLQSQAYTGADLVVSTTSALKDLRLGPTAPPPSYHTESVHGSEDYEPHRVERRVKFPRQDNGEYSAAKLKRLPPSPETYKCAKDGTSVLMKQALVAEG